MNFRKPKNIDEIEIIFLKKKKYKLFIKNMALNALII